MGLLQKRGLFLGVVNWGVKCKDGEKVILRSRVDALSLCLQLKSAKTVAHCTFDINMTIMVICYGLYRFSGCGQVDAYTKE